MRRSIVVLTFGAIARCTTTPAAVGVDAGAVDAAEAGGAADAADAMGAVQVMMDFTRAGGFYAAPFPSEDRRLAGATGAGDHVDMTGFPNPDGASIVDQMLDLVRADADGFGATSGVFFQLTGATDPARLPDAHRSLAPDAPVFLVGVDAASPDRGQRQPAAAHYEDDGGPLGAPHLLALLPQQGIPLRPHTLYAAVVLRALGDAHGRPLAQGDVVRGMIAGAQPPGLPAAAWASYRAALAELARAGVDLAQIAGLAVFRTGAPAAGLGAVRAAALAGVAPVVTRPFQRTDVFADYCVYQSTLRMPVYQAGIPPYATRGGGWTFDAAGRPVMQREEEANVVVTLPRRAMPAAGFPTVVLIRTGAGGDRPLVNRGVQRLHDGPALVPGTGPALYFARAGFAGVTVDGPLGGLRNTTHGDEQFLVFNVGNPLALRDNVRQSALEIAVLAHALDGFTVAAADCPGLVSAGAARFDTGTLALMGHSMGGTIAPLVLAWEPRYRAAVLSGAGGSFIENVVYKQSPIPVRPALEALLRYTSQGRALGEFDAALSLLQWAGEPADPPVYARAIVREPQGGPARSVLMVQGIVDTYILPPIANSTSLSLGLDLAGTALDATNPRLAMFAPLGSLLDLAGRRAITLPAQGNAGAGGAATAVVVQAAQDTVEDGHEVAFQTEGPKHQYLCFLQSFAAGGAPRVPAPGGQFDPCP